MKRNWTKTRIWIPEFLSSLCVCLERLLIVLAWFCAHLGLYLLSQRLDWWLWLWQHCDLCFNDRCLFYCISTCWKWLIHFHFKHFIFFHSTPLRLVLLWRNFISYLKFCSMSFLPSFWEHFVRACSPSSLLSFLHYVVVTLQGKVSLKSIKHSERCSIQRHKYITIFWFIMNSKVFDLI